MEELENLLDDLMSTYSDRYERLAFLAQVYMALTRLAQQEGFGAISVADYAAAMNEAIPGPWNSGPSERP